MSLNNIIKTLERKTEIETQLKKQILGFKAALNKAKENPNALDKYPLLRGLYHSFSDYHYRFGEEMLWLNKHIHSEWEKMKSLEGESVTMVYERFPISEWDDYETKEICGIVEGVFLTPLAEFLRHKKEPQIRISNAERSYSARTLLIPTSYRRAYSVMWDRISGVIQIRIGTSTVFPSKELEKSFQDFLRIKRLNEIKYNKL